VALDNISLTIPTGMFGLLGPNGAGKSTLMRTLATLQECDSGSVFFGDLDVLDEKDEIRRLLGYLPQDFGVYPKVTAYELLDHFAVLKGLSNRRRRAKWSMACCSKPICSKCATSAWAAFRAACASASASPRRCWATRN
jgi:ABC-type multidrug transport system ATPase subunit